MKTIMTQYVGSKIASENDQINSCTFNKCLVIYILKTLQ